MDMNPDIWGTVAEWVGGVGTTLAFLATASIIYRDSKVRRLAQARKIAYYFRPEDRGPAEVDGRYTKWWIHEVHNLSDEPIYGVKQYQLDSRRLSDPLYLRVKEILLPGEIFRIREKRYPSKSRRGIIFSDNSGRPWIRTLGGKLVERRPYLEWAQKIISNILSYLRFLLNSGKRTKEEAEMVERIKVLRQNIE